MESLYDIKKILQLKSGQSVELRISHIAKLWYVDILGKKTAPYIYPVIDEFFPDLILRSAGYGKGESEITEDFYIKAYQKKDGEFGPGPTSKAYDAVRALVGSNSGRYEEEAQNIQKRVAEELYKDETKIQKLRTHYESLIKELDTAQKIKFSGLFKKYLNDVAEVIKKSPKGQVVLFPFEPNELFLNFNNEYLHKLLSFPDDRAYADFFLWMNLAALLRNEIGLLMGRYNLSFENEKENHDLLLRIFENDRKNHPSIRMMDPDPLLFPKGLPEIFSDGRFAVEEEEAPRALRDMILDSWKCEDRRHILLVGEGGIGKTVAMLTLPEEDWFKGLGIPVIYVPLQRLDIYEGDLNRYIKEKIGSNNYENCIDLANRASEGHPRLLLLLDGFNEIPDKFKKKAELYIREWMERPGIQIITTSRLGFFLENRFLKYRLQPLPYETVRSFLLSAGIAEEQLPGWKDRIWEVINVPLMLAMYTQIEKVMETVDRSSAASILEWKEPDNAAHIIWDYLQMELHRCIKKADSSYSIMQYVVAIFAVAPYICSQMSRQNKFYIKRAEFLGLIRNVLSFYNAHPDMLCNQIQNVREEFDPYHEEELFQEGNLAGYARILIDNIGLFQTQKIPKTEHEKGVSIDCTCSLTHQNFRDALSAFFICSCLPKAYGAKEKKALLDQADHYVKDYMSEHLSDRELVSIWDRHRKEDPEDGQTTFILMDLVGRQRNYDYRNLDFSGIDLTKTNLHRLLSRRLDICPLPRDGNKLSNTKISVNCLSPNGHDGAIMCVAYSPDGRHLASGASDSTVLWNLESGERRILEGCAGKGKSVAYSPDGRHFARADEDGAVRIWNLESGESRVLKCHDRWTFVYGVAYSPDGRHLASGFGRMVRILDLESGESRVLEGHASSVMDVAYSPDGRHLASGDSGGTVRIWDLESGKSRVLEGHADWVNSVAYSPDGRQLASGSYDFTVRIWDLANGESRVLEGHAKMVYSVAYSPDGRQLASGSYDRTVRIWDLASGESRVLEGHVDGVLSVAYSPDGRQLASGSIDRSVWVWDLVSGESRVLEGYAGSVMSVMDVAYSPDGRHIVSGASDRTVRIWDLASGESRVLEGHAGKVSSVAYSPDGRHIASGSYDRTVRIWDIESGESRLLEGHAGGVSSVAYSPDGRHLASGSYDSTVRIWDLASSESRVLEEHADGVRSVAYSPDGRHLASGGRDVTVRIWDLESGESRVMGAPSSYERIMGLAHEDWANSVAFRSDGRQLAIGTDESSVLIWDTSARWSFHDIERHAGWVESVAYSPDGRHLASGSYDSTVRIWDLESDECRALEGHADEVSSVAYSPDGRHLASGSYDRTVRIWDLEKYQEVEKYVMIPHINLSGANFELAIIDEKDKQVLRAAGARL